jgi:hypothetical protein
MNAEALLISLVGTPMRKSACGFALDRTADEVFAVVSRVHAALVRGVEDQLRSRPAPPIAALIRKLR